MKIVVFGALFFAGFIGGVRPAYADSGCQGKATRNVSAIEDSNSILKKGETIGDLILYAVNESGKPSVYAQTGGYSYPASAIKLLNCHVVKEVNPNTPGFIYYLKLNNTPENASTILRVSIEKQLENAGMDDADAGNAADAYLNAPKTACGRAAKMILEGHTELVGAVDSGGVCQY